MSLPITRNIFLGILVLFSFIFIYILNYNFPIHSDDWVYTFIFGQDETIRINNIVDIFPSQYHHYMLWGGRSVVHFIAQILLMLESIPRAIANSTVYCLFLFFIYKLSNKGTSDSPILFTILFCTAWLSLPYFPQTVLWTTGSANYLWGTTIGICFLYPAYCYFLNSESSKESPKNYVANYLYFVAGILTGWTNENLAIAIIFLLISLLIYLKISHQYIPKWILMGLIGTIIGCTIMLLAPGNLIRSTEINEALGLNEKTLKDLFLYKARNIYLIYKYLPQINLLTILYLCLFAAHILWIKRTINNKKIYGSFIFLLAAHLSIFVMMGSPIFPPRATFCSITFLMIANGILLSELNYNKYQKSASLMVLLILLIVFYFSYIKRYESITVFKNEIKEREMLINEAKNNKDYNIIFTKKLHLPYYFDFEDLSRETSDWRNKAFSKYYNIESVQLIVSDENK